MDTVTASLEFLIRKRAARREQTARVSVNLPTNNSLSSQTRAGVAFSSHPILSGQAIRHIGQQYIGYHAKATQVIRLNTHTHTHTHRQSV